VISSHGLWLKWWTASEAQTSAGIISATGGAHFADAYPRQIDVLTHISPFWRTYSSNDSDQSAPTDDLIHWLKNAMG